MLPSQVASYNDDDLIGTDATTADDNFDPTHPLYRVIARLGGARGRRTRRCATAPRSTATPTAGPGVFAFSRIDADASGVEYVVALNNAETAKTAGDPDLLGRHGLHAGSGRPDAAGLTTERRPASCSVTVPPLSAVVYRADGAVAADSQRPGVTITVPAAGAAVTGAITSSGPTLGSGRARRR